MSMSERWEGYFDNWNLLRREMHLEKQKFIEKNAHKYPDKVSLRLAMYAHIDRKFKKEAEMLMVRQFDMMLGRDE